MVGGFGWRTHTIEKDDVPITSWDSPQLLSFDERDAPLSLALGVLGMPGYLITFPRLKYTMLTFSVIRLILE